MSVLNKKLLRDLVRLWAQALAIALVLACGVATLILAVGAYRSLAETRAAYYERYRFADIFMSLTRAPNNIAARINEIPGVAAVETRVVTQALLDIEDVSAPATGMILSLPDFREARLNRLFVRAGRLPEPGRSDEVVVNEDFAQAQGFSLGSTFSAVVHGTRQSLTVVGVALSPEYVYAIGPGDLVPDNRRFGIIWMSQQALAGMTDLEGAFNNVSLGLLKGANEREVIAALDALLARYGGSGAYGRADQISHAFLDSELTQLSAMAKVIPPIFLAVSAFLINMILSRLIALEREQIGLLKALGYGKISVAAHYLKLVALIAIAGIIIGFLAGRWLGHGLTRLYAEFYSFPFLIFTSDMDVYVIAGGISMAAALAGGLKASLAALTLPPAVAMRPPAPTRYRRSLLELLGLLRPFSQLTVMAVRHLVRRPLRSFMTALGVAFSGALLITALFSTDSITSMVETMFFLADRQDATLTFYDDKGPAAISAAAHLPGLLRSEPFRAVSVKLRNGHYERRLVIVGKTRANDLSRVLDRDLAPVSIPETGLALSDHVAKVLHVRRGDLLEVETMQGRRRTVRVPVTEIIQNYLGLAVYMDMDALDRLTGDGVRVSGVYIAVDPNRLDDLYRSVKDTPAMGSISVQKMAYAQFRETVEKNITIMTIVYLVLSVIIAFGVVYNSARIQLSERARELASLRVLGFTKAEVSRVLLVELSIIVLFAVPLSWVLGYGFAWTTIQGFATDLFRIPFVVNVSTFAKSSIVVLIASIVSGLIVHRRVNNLDLIRVLKTRE